MPLSNPVSPVSTQNQDFHSRMDENSTNMHLPKGMRLAENGTNVVKYASGDVQYIPINPLPAALDFADSSIAPVTEVDGDIYILDTSLSSLTVTDIVWQSGTTVRISFSGSPDLSSTTVEDYFIISTASNDSNNGRFILSDVNDGSDFIEIENSSRTDATDDETSISIASNIGFRDWDGAINNEWVTFNASATPAEWQRIVPEEGLLCYLKDEDDLYSYNGNSWLQETGTFIPTYTSTDNALPKADGVGGTLQDSGFIVDDFDNLTGISSMEFPNVSSTDLISQIGSNMVVQAITSDNAFWVTTDNGTEAEGVLYVGTSEAYIGNEGFNVAASMVLNSSITTSGTNGAYIEQAIGDLRSIGILHADNSAGDVTTRDVIDHRSTFIAARNVTIEEDIYNAPALGGEGYIVDTFGMPHTTALNEHIDALSATTGTIDIDDNLISAGAYKTVTATGNITLNATTVHSTINSVVWYLEFTQDAGGTNTLTLGTNFLTPGGVAPVVSLGANDSDVLVFRTDSAGNHRLIEHRKAYA